MEIIYLDLHFLVNLLADYLIALCAAMVCGLRLKRLRYLLSALVGALYAVAAVLLENSILSSAAFKLIFAFLMALIAYGGEKQALRCTGVFLGISALFAGLVQAVGGSISLKALLLSFALCYGGMKLFFKDAGKMPEKKRVEIQLELMGEQVRFMALADTGNCLTDPISGMAVMLACPHALKGLFKEDAPLLELEGRELLELSADFPRLRGKFRLLPYKSVGGSGMLPVFRPDRIVLDGREEKELLVAVSKAAYGDGFEAII